MDLNSSIFDEGKSLKELVQEIFLVSQDSKVLEKILNFFESITVDVSTLELINKIKLEITKKSYQINQEENKKLFKLKTTELLSLESDIKSSFVPNPGGGDCAVYSIQDSLKLKGKESIQDIRKDICNKVISFAKLERLNPKISYKEIFSDNFELLKAITCKYYDDALGSCDNTSETISSRLPQENVEKWEERIWKSHRAGK